MLHFRRERRGGAGGGIDSWRRRDGDAVPCKVARALRVRQAERELKKLKQEKYADQDDVLALIDEVS